MTPDDRDDAPSPAPGLLAWVSRARSPRRAGVLAIVAGAGLAATLVGRDDGTHTCDQAPVVVQSATRTAVRVHPSDAADRDAALALALDVWSEHHGDGLPMDLVIDAASLDRLDALGLRPEILVEDIDAVARAEAARLASPEAQRPGDFFSDFKDYGAISAHLEALAAEAPELAKLSVVGGSIEGRPIWALRIGGNAVGATPMLVNGTQHAREWISAMVTTCVADRLVHGYGNDPQIRDFVDRTELWVVPVVNPDGYQYAWSSDRYWRKNRRGTHGVDLNRNFDVAFGGAGSSSDKRSQVYRGEHSFSEPESSALRDLVRREEIALHIDFHSYGQLVLYPWNYTPAPAPGRDRLVAIADALVTAIAARWGTRYTPKSGAALYPAAGTLSDWMFGAAGALSFTIELRPKGGSGFVLPPDQIRPTCDEGLAAVLTLGARGRG